MAEPQERSHNWKWWVCGLLLLASMFLYMDRQTLGNVSARLLWEFDLSNEQYGNLGFAFGIAFAAGGLTFGLTRKSHTAELALTLQPIFADASSIRLHFFHCKLRLSSPFSTEFHFPFSPFPP